MCSLLLIRLGKKIGASDFGGLVYPDFQFYLPNRTGLLTIFRQKD
jgi:hypothetical protein